MPVIAGPCAIEGRDILINIAQLVKQAGASFIRGALTSRARRPIRFKEWEKKGLRF